MRLEVTDGGAALAMRLDGQRVGYEIELSAAHDFLGPGVDKFVVGSALGEAKGFRGCIANFTINGELQTLEEGYSSSGLPLLRADIPAGVHVDGCDLQILQSVAPKDAVDIGVTVIIIFFVLLICAIAASFVFFKLRKRYHRKKEQEAAEAAATTKGGVYDGGYSNRGIDLQESSSSRQLHQLNNAVTTAPSGAPSSSSGRYKPKIRPTTMNLVDINGGGGVKPDLLDTRRRMHSVSPMHHQHPSSLQHLHGHGQSPTADLAGGGGGDLVDHYNEPVEHYDLENASSIAPSDIDVIYHYKVRPRPQDCSSSSPLRDKLLPFQGYRDGSNSRHRHSGGKSLNSRRRSNYLKNTPLARLSPSSEMSHNNPRHILTLGDLSGKSLPQAALLESERSLNSPVSHVSAASSHSRRRHQRQSPAAATAAAATRGLTSENVARFNQRTQQQQQGRNIRVCCGIPIEY